MNPMISPENEGAVESGEIETRLVKNSEQTVDLRRYMGRGEKLFLSGTDEVIKELRENDRL